MDSGRIGRRLLSVVSGFELVGWGVADGGVEAGGVPPVDPGQGGEFDVIDAAPWASHGDQFALVEADDRLGHGVGPRRQRHPIPPVRNELFG